MDAHTKQAIIELLPVMPQAVIREQLSVSRAAVSRVCVEYMATCSEEKRREIEGQRYRKKSEHGFYSERRFTEEKAKLYHDQSLTAPEIGRLLGISADAARDRMRMHGYRPPVIRMTSQLLVIDRRAWLQKIGYDFDTARKMQPDYVEEKNAKNDKGLASLVIKDALEIVNKNPWLYRKVI